MSTRKRTSAGREALRNRIRNNSENNGNFGKKYIDTSNFEDVKWFKPSTKSKNLIDILPFIIESKNHPQGMKVGEEDYILDIYVHKNVGPRNDSFLCLSETYNKPCPICEERARLAKAGKEDEANELKPKHRAVYNIIDLNNPDEGIQIFDTIHWYFEHELMDEVKSPDAPASAEIFADLEEGCSIKFRAVEEKYGKATFLKFKNFDFEDRDETYPEEILDDVYPLDTMLIIPSYEEVSASFYGENFEEEEEEEKDNPPRRKRASTKKEEVEENNDEQGEEVPEEESSRRRERRERKPKAPACPYGFEFGEDNLTDPKCDECEIDHEDIYEACCDKYDLLEDEKE